LRPHAGAERRRGGRRGAARPEQRERVGAVGPGVSGAGHRRQQLVRGVPFVEGVEGEQLLAQPGALAAREGGEEGGGDTPGHDIRGHIPVTSLADGSQGYRRQADGSSRMVWHR